MIVQLLQGILIAIMLLADSPTGTESPGEGRRTVEERIAHMLSESRELARTGNHDSSTALAVNAVELASQPGIADTLYLKALEQLGNSALTSGDLAKGYWAYSRARAIAISLYGRESQEFVQALLNLAWTCDLQKRPDEAEKILQEALKIQETLQGRFSIGVANVLFSMSRLHWRQGRFPDAVDNLKDAIERVERGHGSKHNRLPGLYHTLGRRYRMLAHLSQAEQCFMQSLMILEDDQEASPVKIAEVLHELGQLYLDQGKYREAKTCLSRGLGYLEPVPEISQGTTRAQLLNALCGVLRVQGKHSEAQRAYLQAIDIRERVNGKNSPNVAEPLGGLGELYLEMGLEEDAEACYLRALELRVKDPQHGPDHQFLFYHLIGLAEVYLRWDSLTAADSMLRWAERNVRRAYGANHTHTAECQRYRARLTMAEGDYQQADSLLREALTTYDNICGPMSFGAAEVWEALALTHAAAGQLDASMHCYAQLLDIRRRFLPYAFSFSSQAQKLRWVDRWPVIDDSFISLAIGGASADACEAVLEMVLMGKAAVLDAVRAEQSVLRNNDDLESRELRASLASTYNVCAGRFYAGPGTADPDGYRDSMVTIEKRIDSLEQVLSQKYSNHEFSLCTMDFSVTDVATTLPDNGVLWEFVRYTPYDFSRPEHSQDSSESDRYVGLCVNRHGMMNMVDLGNAKTVDTLVLRVRDEIRKAAGWARSGRRWDLHSDYLEAGQRLFDAVFTPMISCLDTTDVSEIIVSPDGLLNLLPFEILPYSDSDYVVEHHSISYVTSGHDLLRNGTFDTSRRNVLIFANPDYNRTAASSVPGCANLRFWPLPHTLAEAEDIATTCRDSGGLTVEVFSGAQASETMFKNRESSPLVIHVATHGFFCDYPAAIGKTLSQNPLLLSGLAFAGANGTSQGHSTRNAEGNDGLLTALEVSALDLEGTSLVVLSACGTALGEIRSGEGVFGLRRAFQQAGASSVMISMWEVPDQETHQLMAAFYRTWLDGTSKKVALRRSMLDMIRSLRAELGVAHPYLWGGFVLVGDPS